MKTTIFLMFSFFFITGSLFGQKDKHSFIDSDIRKKFFPVISLDSPRLRKPDLYSPKKIDNPALSDFERFGINPESSFFRDKKVRLYSDFVVVEEFPGASQNFAKRPDLLFFPYEKSFIIKPDTTIKQYLRIIDPTPRIMRR